MERVVRLRSTPIANGRLDTDIAHSNLPIVRGVRIFGSDESQVILTLAIHQSDLKNSNFSAQKIRAAAFLDTILGAENDWCSVS